jgi:oxygen-independent coproporphyrinogen-3 oxidase
MLGLYLHVPFCESICGYCNFNRGLLDDALKTRYVSALEAELKSIDDLGMGDW